MACSIDESSSDTGGAISCDFWQSAILVFEFALPTAKIVPAFISSHFSEIPSSILAFEFVFTLPTAKSVYISGGLVWRRRRRRREV